MNQLSSEVAELKRQLSSVNGVLYDSEQYRVLLHTVSQISSMIVDKTDPNISHSSMMILKDIFGGKLSGDKVADDNRSSVVNFYREEYTSFTSLSKLCLTYI